MFEVGDGLYSIACVDDPSLEALLRKVQAGESLSDGELLALREGPASYRLRLAVGHALANAGADRDALPLFEALVIERPHDVSGHLGRARALVGLERYTEAEEVLRQALRVNPGDPEALKAIALLSMRRGAVRQAGHLVEEALAKDPFDVEARLVHAELTEAELPAMKPAPASREAFTASFCAKLAEAKLPYLAQGSELFLKLPGGRVVRLELSSLYGGYLELGLPLREGVSLIVSELSDAAAGEVGDRARVLNEVRPVLRAKGFEAQAAGALHRPGPAGLHVYYVLHHPELLRYLPSAALGARGLTEDEVHIAAFTNLEEAPGKPLPIRMSQGEPRPAQSPGGLWALAVGDGYDAARLLSSSEQQRLRLALGPTPLAVSLERRELALVWREDDVDAALEAARMRPGADGIRGRYRLKSDGALERLEAP
jgi:tetratricopeptide (TPR) repeat protein